VSHGDEDVDGGPTCFRRLVSLHLQVAAIRRLHRRSVTPFASAGRATGAGGGVSGRTNT